MSELNIKTDFLDYVITSPISDIEKKFTPFHKPVLFLKSSNHLFCPTLITHLANQIGALTNAECDFLFEYLFIGH